LDPELGAHERAEAGAFSELEISRCAHAPPARASFRGLMIMRGACEFDQANWKEQIAIE